MKIVGFIWLEEIVEKLDAKHQVTTDETEQVFDKPAPSQTYEQRPFSWRGCVSGIRPNRRRPLSGCFLHLQDKPRGLDPECAGYG